MDTVLHRLTQALSEAVSALNLPEKGQVHFTDDLQFGDISANHALVLAKEAKQAPKELAEAIIAKLPALPEVAEVSIAGPGFINFTLAPSFFTEQLQQFLEKPPMPQTKAGTRVLIEHSSPNLFKPFHIGHLVNNAYGEALVRLHEAVGAEVIRISWPSDVSPGIAKAVWGLMQLGKTDDFTITDVGEAYALGTRAYKEDEAAKAEIDRINKALYEKDTDSPYWPIYQRGRELSLQYFTDITSRLGSSFDVIMFESDSEKVGKRIVKEHTPGVFEESEGAIIFPGSRYGLFDNVFINSAGFGTYLAKDLGLLAEKFERFAPFAETITITDIEQKAHFQLVKKAAELVNPEWAEKARYLHHGRLSLTTGRISSRDGNVPLAEEVIEAVKAAVLQRMQEGGKADDPTIAEQVALAALKFDIVRVSMGKHMVFDMQKATSFEGDSGPYLQYTHARAKAVLEKAGGAPSEKPATDPEEPERLLYRFPEIVARAQKEYAPALLANYLLELAAVYNSWYATARIIGSPQETRRLQVTAATAAVLSQGLALLGMQAPDRL